MRISTTQVNWWQVNLPLEGIAMFAGPQNVRWRELSFCEEMTDCFTELIHNVLCGQESIAKD